MADEETKLDTKNLDKLIKALSTSQIDVRVGILGSSNARSGGSSNATIGAAHEFGTSTLPIRSFLRIPLSSNLMKALEASGLFDKQALTEVVASNTIMPWANKIGIVAQGVVTDSFNTGGANGEWPASNMANKQNQQTLVETGQLKNSITYEVVGGES